MIVIGMMILQFWIVCGEVWHHRRNEECHVGIRIGIEIER
jgi:hypothetical protein